MDNPEMEAILGAQDIEQK